MFGPVRSIMKSTTENQLFEIKLEYLIDLGNGVEEKTGRINLENQLNFEEFKTLETELNKIQKLQDSIISSSSDILANAKKAKVKINLQINNNIKLAKEIKTLFNNNFLKLF